ncbi:RND family transporter [Candidatus Riflebacteria bacterium]
MATIVRFILRYRLLFVFILIITVLVSLRYCKELKIDNSVDVWFVDGDPHLKAYYSFQEHFGNDEVIVVAFKDKKGIFRQETLELIGKSTTEIEELKDIERVTCLTSAVTIDVNAEGDLAIGKLVDLDELKGTEEELKFLKRKALDDDQIVDNLLSKDAKTTLMLVQLKANPDIDALRDKIFYQVKAILDKYFKAAKKSYHLAGVGVLYTAINELSIRDAAIFFSLSDMVIIFTLYFVLRRKLAVLISLSVVLLTIVITMGFMGYIGKSLNMVTIALPSLLMIIGIADAIHVLTHYFEEKEANIELNHEELIVKSFSYILVPCFYTSLTTAIGFSSLIFAKMGVVRDLGLFASFGCAVAYIVTGLVCIIFLGFVEIIPPKKEEIKFTPYLKTILGWVETLIFKRQKLAIGICFLLSLVSFFGIFYIKVDTFSIRFLKESHWARIADRFIEENFNYYIPLEFTIKSKDPLENFYKPQILEKVAQYQQIITAEKFISKSISVPTIIKRMNQSLNENKPEFKRIPPTSEAVSQEMLIYSNEDAALTSYVNYPKCDYLRISSRLKMMSAGKGRVITDRLLLEGKKLFGPSFEVTAAGYLPLYSKMIDYIVESQIISFSFAFVFIGILMAVIFKSWSLTFLALLPNIFPLLLCMGFLGWFGIPLDVATVMICSICLGIAVDDTIHVVSMLSNQMVLKEDNYPEAMKATLWSTGTAVISTSFILFCGFMVLAFASIKSMIYFGILTGISMVSAVIGDLIILPILFLKFRPKISSIL